MRDWQRTCVQRTRRRPRNFSGAGQLSTCCFHHSRRQFMRETIQVKGIRAPAYTSSVTKPVRRIERIQRGTAEPPSVALLRHILNPMVIVSTLLLTVVAYGSPLSQHYLALAALAFLI